MLLALIPYLSSRTVGGPDLGTSVTASFFTVISFSRATALSTASPRPPANKIHVIGKFQSTDYTKIRIKGEIITEKVKKSPDERHK